MKRLAVVGAALAGACTMGRDYAPPVLQAPAAWSDPQVGSVQEPPELARFWTLLTDPALDALVERAVGANLDLHTAWLRIVEARAAAGLATAARGPELSAGADYARQRQSEAFPGFAQGREFDSFGLGFDALWELDLFGRLGREAEAAQAQIGVAFAQWALTQVTLTGEVAAAYVRLRSAQQRQALATRGEQVARDLLALVVARQGAGTGDELDVARAQRQLAVAQAQLPSHVASAATARHTLALLCGAPASEFGAELRQSAALPNAPVAAVLGLPADVVRRRPDVRAGERALAAATAQVAAAEAARYPTLRILGSFTQRAERSNDLLDWGSRAWNVGPSLDWPLLTSGRLTRTIELRDAQVEQARTRLEQTVLRAFAEVEDGLATFLAETERSARLAEAVTAAQRARELAQVRFDAGSADFLDVIEAEQQRLALDDQLALAQRDALLAWIALHKALGGGLPAPATGD